MNAFALWKLFVASLNQRKPRRQRRVKFGTEVEAVEARTLLTSTLLGQQIFPSDNPMNQNIANAPVAANSAAIISHIGSSIHIHPDWGDDNVANGTSPLYGIPFNVVHGSTTAKINVVIDNYPGESDITPVPIPQGAVIEGDFQGGPNPNGGGYKTNQRGDSHLIVWDEDNDVAYELYGVTRPTDPTLFPNPSGVELPHTDGVWHAAQETVWNMKTNTFRTLGETSADAAGLSILAGLVRPDEGLPSSEGGQGLITHALRMTLPSGDINPQYIYPASHMVTTSGGTNDLPLGSRLRLANTPAINTLINNMPPESQIIARAMQQYGLIVADIGSAMYVTGTSASVDANNHISLTWNQNDIFASNGLKVLTAGDFQVVNLAPLVTGLSASSGTAGQTITITGQNFSGAAGHLSVFFNNTAATTVTVLSDTQISAVVPAGTGTVDVTVQLGIKETDTISDNPNANVNAPIFGYGTSAKSSADLFTFSTTTAVAPTIKVTGGPYVYDGTSHSATVSVTGTVAGDPNPTGTTAVTYTIGGTTTSTPPVFAGIYKVNVSFTSTDPNYLSATSTGSLTIKPVVSTASAQYVNALQNLSTGSVLLATFSVTTGQALVASDYTGSINWSDGSALDTSSFRAVISSNNVQVYGTHTYSKGGRFHPVVALIFQGTVSNTATLQPTVIVASDISSSFTTQHTAPVLVTDKQSPYVGLYQGSLTVTNSSASTITGNLEIALTGLSVNTPGSKLRYAFLNVGGSLKALTILTDSAGDPVIYIPSTLVGSLAPNTTLSLTLYFGNPKSLGIAYSPKIYSVS